MPVVNIDGHQPGQMKLTGQVLADIYLGKITKWNDPAHRGAESRRAKLPDADITVVHRADGSGTTFIFTNYLSKVSPEWKAKVGEGTAVNWPTGAGGKGNEGVAAFVQRLPGLDRLRRVRLRQAEQDDLRADEEPGRQLRRSRATRPSRPRPPAPTGRTRPASTRS